MTTMMTTTTPELRYYYSDLHRLPRLSDEERQRLQALLASAHGQPLLTPEATHAKQRLIEGHLSLATSIAAKLCPATHASALPDLVQAANLTLIEATNSFPFAEEGDYYKSYIAACVCGSVKGAMAHDTLIRVSSSTLDRARKAGTLEQVYAMQPVSLDRPLKSGDEEEQTLLGDLLAAPSAPPTRDERKLAQVDRLLSSLSPRGEQIMRLRYGLASEEDERMLSTREVAQVLGITQGAVKATEQDALRRLRALASGQVRLITRAGRPCTVLCGRRGPHLFQQRQEQVVQAYQRLQARGETITQRRLAQEAGVTRYAAGVFLQERRGVSKPAERQQARLEQLEAAVLQLQAAGKPVNRDALRHLAKVGDRATREFLRIRKQQQEATYCSM